MKAPPYSWNLAGPVENRVGDQRDSICVWSPRVKLRDVLVVTQICDTGVKDTAEQIRLDPRDTTTPPWLWPEFLSKGFWPLPSLHRRF